MKTLINILCCLCCLFGIVACHEVEVMEPTEEDTPVEFVDTLNAMEHLQEIGVLRALTNQRQLNYRLLDGRPAGFQFELLDDFSEILNLTLDLKVNDSLAECLQLLKDREIDLYAGAIDTLLLYDSSFYCTVIDLPVVLDQTFAWVILNRDGDSSLVSAITLWMDDYRESDLRRSFYRYFNGRNLRNDSSFRVTNQICRYDKLIKAEAAKIGWDWRFLASIIYQESHFKPDLESEKGAFGLMQLMPVTMEKYGIDYDSSVEEQLEAGGKVLLHFDRELPESITDSLEREKFVLASYNAGMGHVLESRIVAEKHGKNPDLWTDNVELFTPRQTYFFVRDVTKRFSYYKTLIE